MVLRCVLLKYCLFEKSRNLNIKIKGKMKFGEDPINIFYSNHYNLKNSAFIFLTNYIMTIEIVSLGF